MREYLQFPIAVHNLFGPNKNKSLRRQTITKFLDAAKGGVGGANELAVVDRSFFRAEASKRGLRSFIYVTLAVVWDPKVAMADKPRLKKVMQGGYVGADGVATSKKGDDDRRVGPNRYAIYLPLDFPEVDLFGDFELDVTHLVAKWTTTHKWRAALARRSIYSLADGVVSPNGLMVGDMNTNTYVNLPGVADVPVKTPPTHGPRKYDQILRWGQHVYVSQVKDVPTPSDHDMVVGLVTIYRAPKANLSAPATSKPKAAKLPRPGDSKTNWRKHGAPVKHPWAKRSPRWIRRNKNLWARIIRWQKAYKRRLSA